MEFVVKGGTPLHGETAIAGAKNAALGLLAASIMADEDVFVRNIPDVSDVNTLLEAIADTGAKVKRLSRHEVLMNGRSIRSYVVNNRYIRRMRAGYYMSPFWAAVLVFSINEGAYCAETMRGALEAVPVGQIEAGYCVGMSYTQIMRRIVLPQALRTAFPPLSNSLISMVKDTSLASNITVAEMFMATQRINARYYEPLALYLEVAVIYLIFCTLLTWLQRLGEKKLSAYTKKEARHA